MKPYYEQDGIQLFLGDCRDVLPLLPDCSVDSIVTDPPYFLTNENGNGFMGKAWDSLSLSNAIVDALFRSARLVLSTDAVSTVPVLVSTAQDGSGINRTGNVPSAESGFTEAHHTPNLTTNSVRGLVITKQEALVLCGVLLPDHTGYLQSLPMSAVLVLNDLSIVLSGKSTARKLATILLDDPVWLEQITTFTSTDSTERSATGVNNGSSFASESTNATAIHASDAESIAGEKRSSATISSLTIFQEITAKIISSPFATRAIRLCTKDPSLIPVLSEVFHRRWSREALRVLKPGGHLLAFAGTRTYHRLVSALEDEGFEIRDQLQWIHGQGFPKSLDVSKAIDAAAGAEREISHFGTRHSTSEFDSAFSTARERRDDPITNAAKQWNGWGTALKPAHEPIVMARKPLDGTVAENVLKHGTGGINVDGCRIEGEPTHGSGTAFPANGTMGHFSSEVRLGVPNLVNNVGRWPANVLTDGSDEVVRLFPETTSGSKDLIQNGWGSNGIYGQGQPHRKTCEGDSGSAARFFYCAKASKEDREEGLEDLPIRSAGEVTDREDGSDGLNSPRAGAGRTNGSRNHHPTVKPTDLMRYLVRLVTPPNGTVLDPFGGSGSTAKACAMEDFKAILIEKEIEYCEIAMRRAQLRQRRLTFA